MTRGLIKTYETPTGIEEALVFNIEGKEHWTKRYLNNDRYQIFDFLGTGGLGCVFKAYDRWNYDNKVVIKTPYYMGDFGLPYITRGKSVFEKQILSFNKIYQREKKHLIEFSNAGFDSVVNLNDFFYDRSVDLYKNFRNAAGVKYYIEENLRENAPFIVLKYIRGETLADIINKDVLDEYSTLLVTKQVLTLMKYLHKVRTSPKGKEYYYLLCDMKAENIMVTDNFFVSLLDFGAVKIYWVEQGEIDIPIFVTDGYAAPEVYSGSLDLIDNPRIDNRFDLFTVGALMVYCLTGKKPKEFLVSSTPPQHNFDLDDYKNFSSGIKNIIHKATMPRHKDRYPDCSTMLYDVLGSLNRLY